VRIEAYSIPADTTAAAWPSELIDDSLHTTHNFELVNLDQDPALEVLVASWEGVHSLDRGEGGRWARAKLGEGYQAAELPNKGASEIKYGLTGVPLPVIATVEPWHGRQVVLYVPREFTVYAPFSTAAVGGPWTRQVIDDGVTWGHAVWFANLDGVRGDELIVGQRDSRNDAAEPKGPGVWVYDLNSWKPADARPPKVVVDDGGMACEDALAVDLDGDGRPEIVAGGRATHNVKVYWNRTPKPAGAP
jgi:hypothetical protein